MAAKVETDWTAVIARCLAFLCLDKAKDEDPDKFNAVKKKVDFLKGMGLPQNDAAYVAGSTPASVVELNRLHNNKGAKGGTKKRG